MSEGTPPRQRNLFDAEPPPPGGSDRDAAKDAAAKKRAAARARSAKEGMAPLHLRPDEGEEADARTDAPPASARRAHPYRSGPGPRPATTPRKRPSQVGDEEDPLTVSGLTLALKRQIEHGWSRVYVAGELADVTRSARGHVYFDLKDDDAVLHCVMWASDLQRLKFDLEDGLEVVAGGALSVYEKRGTYQFYVKRVTPRGRGALQLAVEQLAHKLHGEGLFALERKRRIPMLPRCVGVVTSAYGAALRDVRMVMRRRFPSMPIRLIPCTVQGESAAGEVAAAIRRANRYVKQGGVIDVLLVTRGGGSYEDLMAFNDERVARAIAASTIPVVSAVGHEIDTTIADLVADRRALTPSEGAELVVPEQRVLQQRIRSLEARFARTVRRQVHTQRRHLDQLSARLAKGSPTAQLDAIRRRLRAVQAALPAAMARSIERTRSRLDRARHSLLHLDPARETLPRLRKMLGDREGRLHRAMEGGVATIRRTLAHKAAQLDAYSPLQVLGRGYSVTLDEAGTAVTDAATLSAGDTVRTMLHRGEIDATITAIRPAEPTSPDDNGPGAKR